MKCFLRITKQTVLCLAMIGMAHAFDHSHAAWQAVLTKRVDARGWVDYAGLMSDRTSLDAYVASIRKVPPGEISTWSAGKRKAFWINAYNALTVELILANYPLKSIRDISKPWDRAVLLLGKTEYTLNDIEHEILRKKHADPRLHMALVCASTSCPALSAMVFTGENLEEELDRVSGEFVQDPLRNDIPEGKRKIRISKIFEWYGDDFKSSGGVKGFLEEYGRPEWKKTIRKAKVGYLKYDWSLNGQDRAK